MQYKVILFALNTARASMRDWVTAITGVSHASSVVAGGDIASGSDGTFCTSWLSVDDTGYKRCLALSRAHPGFYLCAFTHDGLNVWTCVKSDWSAIAVDSTYTEAQMRAEFADDVTLGQSVTAFGASGNVFGESWTNKADGEGIAGGAVAKRAFAFKDNADPINDTTTSDILVVSVQDDGGTWKGCEIISADFVGYGTHEFKIANRVDNIDEDITFGAFTFAAGADGGVSPNEELDWEFGQVLAINSNDALATLWYLDPESDPPNQLTGNTEYVEVGSVYFTRYKLTWTSTSVTWEAYLDGATTPFYTRTVTENVPQFSKARWRWLAWIFNYSGGARPAAAGRWSIFDYTFTPA